MYKFPQWLPYDQTHLFGSRAFEDEAPDRRGAVLSWIDGLVLAVLHLGMDRRRSAYRRRDVLDLVPALPDWYHWQLHDFWLVRLQEPVALLSRWALDGRRDCS